jgi:hypothetical protein
MLERLTPILRLVCIVLAGLILFQVSRLVARRNTFAQINVGSGLPASARAATPKTEAPKAEAPKTEPSTNKPPSSRSQKPPGPQVPPEIAARVEKIKESQVLGMIMRPPPMALLGIAGADVILRGPNGQMGIVRVGEELGGVKLLQVGVNRVLVLHEGNTNELILFEGIGGEPLLRKEKSK